MNNKINFLFKAKDRMQLTFKILIENSQGMKTWTCCSVCSSREKMSTDTVLMNGSKSWTVSKGYRQNWFVFAGTA